MTNALIRLKKEVVIGDLLASRMRRISDYAPPVGLDGWWGRRLLKNVLKQIEKRALLGEYSYEYSSLFIKKLVRLSASLEELGFVATRENSANSPYVLIISW